MIQKLFLVGFLSFILLGCKVKKRTTYGKKSQTRTVQQSTTPHDGGLYKLPEDTGRFIRFEINSTEEYIENFAEMAQFEMKAYGIPASITLAQGLLESGIGKGQLAKKTNNHFGIKCHTDWQGQYELHDDDEKDECFRKYNHPMYSYRDHSLFLKNRARYAFLFDYKQDDYKKWALGLRKAGYATDRRYPDKLISLIEKYDLYKYDRLVLSEVHQKALKNPSDEVPKKPLTTTTHIVQKGDTLYGISKKYSVSIDDLKRWNYLYDTIISEGQELTIKTEAFNSQ